MCLKNLVSKEELAKFKKKLPLEFDVFKVVDGCGCPVWWQSGEDKLIKKGIYKAEQKKRLRSRLVGYKPGFHAFLTRYAARKYKDDDWYRKTKKFRAKRLWITAKGKAGDIPCIVLSKIKVI